MQQKSVRIGPIQTSFPFASLPSAIQILFLLPLLLLFAICAERIEASGNPPMPPSFGLSEEVFTKQAFDEDAAFCKVEKEPCGFYDLSLDGNTQLEWVKSWCRCPARHECAFDEPDLRHKVYRFVCKKEQPKMATMNRNRVVVRRHHGHRRNGGEKGEKGI